ncbi:MAG TPA: hypothetical protein PLI53_03375 [Geobacteraceae bacterium]|nr:hypothetical protein [Geobacteraceae bacterium]
MKRFVRMIGSPVVISIVAVCTLSSASSVIAEPSKSQVIRLWEDQHQVHGRVLDVKSRGGQRSTNELDGKHYLVPVGTCWDYDVVELQKCGCRLFQRASVCCRKGSARECEIRIGTSSKMVDCSTYEKPKFGLSGNSEPGECKAKRTAAACWSRKDLVFGAGSSIGPCVGSGGATQDWPPAFVCPNGYDTVNDFFNGKCGPTPEDCGCTLVEECSNEAGLACYRNWKKSLGR